jgi:hypothetical protein
MSQDVEESEIDPESASVSTDEMGGDPSCWLHLFCADCGVQLDGTPHRLGCTEPPPVDEAD